MTREPWNSSFRRRSNRGRIGLRSDSPSELFLWLAHLFADQAYAGPRFARYVKFFERNLYTTFWLEPDQKVVESDESVVILCRATLFEEEVALCGPKSSACPITYRLF